MTPATRAGHGAGCARTSTELSRPVRRHRSACPSRSASASPSTRSTATSVTPLLAAAAERPRRGQGGRRRRPPRGRRRTADDQLLGDRTLRRPAGPRHRGRHEGPLHPAPLRGRRPLRRLPGPPARPGRRDRGGPSTPPGCCTTSARSASPTPSCASPGKLTDEEYAIVKQHVTLGDRIVHGLPDLELVRGGVRHHHERWDGHGYADGLRGTDIPLIARILAVGDAFSAMTTTRPYRKAMSIEEALRRLEDAAGTQLDEDLVRPSCRPWSTPPTRRCRPGHDRRWPAWCCRRPAPLAPGGLNRPGGRTLRRGRRAGAGRP